MNVEHYENLVGVLTKESCITIFNVGDRLMSLLELYGISVEYGDGVGELFPGNSYTISREEGEIEEYEDGSPPEEYVGKRDYRVNLGSGMAEALYRGRPSWTIPPWLLIMIRQHDRFHVRAYYAANAVIDLLSKGEIAVKYLDGNEWGYEIFKDGRPIRRLPEGRDWQ